VKKYLIGIGAIASAALIVMSILAPQAQAGSEDFTGSCLFRGSRTAGIGRLTDGSYQGAWQAANDFSYVEIFCPELPGGIMVAWQNKPGYWFMLGSDDGAVWKAVRYVADDGYKHQYVSLEQSGYHYLRIMMPRLHGEAFSISEIKLHPKGQIPDDIQIWQPAVSDARLMVLSAHADDESVFFSGILPTYAAERGEDTVVVYMAANESHRASEALSALWAAGVRNYPVFAPFPDQYSETMEDAARFWGGYDAVVEYLAGQIRRFQPEVVLTHDLGGEYGHGAHMLTAAAALDAADLAADPGSSAESAALYGAWDLPKLYLHLYGENRIELDFNTPLQAFGGLTAWQAAELSLSQHRSQLHWPVVRVHSSGKYAANVYGLARTSVGPDSIGGDLFENIPDQ